MIKQLPYEAVIFTHDEYKTMYNEEKGQPTTWEETEYIGIQTKTFATLFSYYRWIAKM